MDGITSPSIALIVVLLRSWSTVMNSPTRVSLCDMFNFSGDFKSKRSINLGGTKKIVPKDELIKDAQAKRQEREKTRLYSKATATIQVYLNSNSFSN